jgi:type II secretory pathway component PulF
MPTFLVSCIVGTNGRTTTREIKAPNVAEARSRLRDLGFYAVALREAGTPMRNRKVARKHLISLFHELSEMLKAHSLIEALGLLKDTFPYRPLRVMLAEIHEKCASASALPPQAFGLYPRTFTPDIIALIEAGEKGGARGLSERFADLEERLRFTESLRKSMVSALAYPVTIFSFVAVMLTFVFIYIVPRFKSLLKTFNSEMPALTQALFDVAEFFQHHWPLVLLCMILPPVIYAGLRKWPAAALLIDRTYLRVPLLGKLLREMITADVASNFCALYNATIKTPENLLSCAAVVRNRYARSVLLKMHRWVTYEGMDVADAFTISKFFPPEAVMSISSGAKASRIAEQMKYVAQNSTRRAKEMTERFFSVLRIVAIFAIGAIVGTFIYALILPIFQAAMRA